MADLYDFTTPIDTWRFTDTKKTISYAGFDYEPIPVKRSRWDKTIDKNEFTVTGPVDVEPFSFYVGFNPSHVLTLKITDSVSGNVEFIGKVVRGKIISKTKTIELKLEDIANVLRGDVPSVRFSPGCNWELYRAGTCELDRDLFGVAFPTSEAIIDEVEFSIAHPKLSTSHDPRFVDKWFTSGFAENGSERIHVIKHVQGKIFVIANFVQLKNATISVFAGCDKQRSTCINKFNNEINFGGFPFVPNVNPVTEGI